MKDPFKKTSKLMSLALRHDPSALNLTLDDNGWAQVESLLSNLNKKGHSLSFSELKGTGRDQ